MSWFVLPILAATAGLIFYQDFKTREVTWILFSFIAIAGLLYSISNLLSLRVIFSNVAMNILFLVVQFLGIKIYFSLKYRTINAQLINRYIGLGDIFFLLASCFFFSPANYILFFCFSLIFSLTTHFLLLLVRKKQDEPSVPLAGFQAIFLAIYFLTSRLLNHNITNDDWIINSFT